MEVVLGGPESFDKFSHKIKLRSVHDWATLKRCWGRAIRLKKIMLVQRRMLNSSTCYLVNFDLLPKLSENIVIRSEATFLGIPTEPGVRYAYAPLKEWDQNSESQEDNQEIEQVIQLSKRRGRPKKHVS